MLVSLCHCVCGTAVSVCATSVLCLPAPVGILEYVCASIVLMPVWCGEYAKSVCGVSKAAVSVSATSLCCLPCLAAGWYACARTASVLLSVHMESVCNVCLCSQCVVSICAVSV